MFSGGVQVPVESIKEIIVIKTVDRPVKYEVVRSYVFLCISMCSYVCV